MVMNEVFERFAQQSPVCVMVQAALENVLSPAALDEIFEETAKRQYTRELLFSTVVQLMSEVVCRVRKSVHAAYQMRRERLNVSLEALYDKLNGMELGVMEALVGHTYQHLAPVQDIWLADKPGPLPGFEVRIVDGNHLAGTQHRLKPLRRLRAGALPGQALVVYDPHRKLITHMIGCEDAHAQERTLTGALFDLINQGQVWIADRNFCTTPILSGIVDRDAYFLIRQHASTLYVLAETAPRQVGRVPSGTVYEQQLDLRHLNAAVFSVRRITIHLDQPTRDGETEVHVLTNLPRTINACALAERYRDRWTIERAFQEIEAALQGEIDTLAYPKAALFAFGLALVASNVLAVVKGALVATQEKFTDTDEVSGYYLAEEIASTYHGMIIALPENTWARYHNLDATALAHALCQLAARVNPVCFRKHKRGPKKPQPRKQSGAKIKHVSTARLLAKVKAVTR